MGWEEQVLDSAIKFLLDGKEIEAAKILRTCYFENCETVDYWMDGGKQLQGLSFELGCPRPTYEILNNSRHPVTKTIEEALRAVLPGDFYLKNIKPRFDSTTSMSSKRIDGRIISLFEIDDFIQNIEKQKELMIAVSTGLSGIQDVNKEYITLRNEISTKLLEFEIDDPNPYMDLWKWYNKWRDGSLPSYQSRRNYIIDLFQPLLYKLLMQKVNAKSSQEFEPTGWARVDRNIEKINKVLESAQNEEDFQTVGLHCRETMISLAQAVYKPDLHGTIDGIIPSQTDAKRMLDSYISKELGGRSSEAKRRLSKTTLQLAVALQHRRTAKFRDAALCSEATRSIVNIIAIISGIRDPKM